MNQILLFPEDYISENRVILKERRLNHLRSIVKIKTGDSLKAGLINGPRGNAVVIETGADYATLETSLTDTPPPPLPLTLVMAMPRPKSLKKAVHYATAMGVKKFFIMRTWKVEKSYFDSPVLQNETLRMEMILALEQSRDTVMPEIHIKKLFRPFVEDELNSISEGTVKLTAHPAGEYECPRDIRKPVTLVIGPEGGLIDFEIRLLEETGFVTVNMGERILRVENAIPAIIGRLY
ncbi:MAG TPA: 16S rRNA (uracil(1498)-N(3))-methyltransferase [Spirochaetota bacterium]|nr:16S rRNA (uracil(1498)-N(3))-methyltransferase [Spirochaetota bacterium]HPJ34223.1 16S rRNA (uracil(1498)-N(3))-methyltransferase [Spirochaetota bacterium]